MEDYKFKYKKYKSKYNNLKKTIGGNKNDIKYSEHLSEPWFSLISLGLKTVEGRKNKGKFKEMKIGDVIEWYNNDFKKRTVLTKIVKKTEYKTFEDYLTSEGLENCLPGIPSLEHGLSVYFKYYTKEDESQYGVIAITLEKI
jgi:ASC-1-like (ASCH) protein